jgi:hypothetical protein
MSGAFDEDQKGGGGDREKKSLGGALVARCGSHVRDRSCRLRCSLLLKARLQNWHLYFLSGASDPFRGAGVDEADVGRTATFAPGIFGMFVAFERSRSDGDTMGGCREISGFDGDGGDDNHSKVRCRSPQNDS